MKWLLPLLLLATPAWAQTPAPVTKCVWVPICLPKYDPPVTAMRIYEGTTRTREIRPWWYPAGDIRTSFFHCGDETKDLSFSLMYKPPGSSTEQETGKATAITPAAGTPCAGAATALPKIGALQGVGDILNGMGSSCLSDPACAQMVMQHCDADQTCRGALAGLLNIDANSDGTKDGADRAVLELILGGVLKP